MTKLSNTQTPASLLEAMKEGAGKKLTKEQTFEQRVSFAYGAMDSDSDVTKEHVRQILSDGEGISV